MTNDQVGLPALDFLALMRPQEEEFRRQHREDVGLVAAAATLNFSCGYLYWLQRTINASIQQPIAWEKVAALYLLNRAIQDLRSALELGERGAPVQGMSLIIGVYEVEVALLEIGRDAAKGKHWLTAEGPADIVFSTRLGKSGQPVKQPIKERGTEFYPSLGIPGTTRSALEQAHEQRYGDIYAELCGYKHIQPSVQRQYGTVRTAHGIEVKPEPQWTPHMRQSVLAMYEIAENLAEHVFLAAAKAHLDPEQESHAARFIRQMRSAWQGTLSLNEMTGEGEGQ